MLGILGAIRCGVDHLLSLVRRLNDATQERVARCGKGMVNPRWPGAERAVNPGQRLADSAQWYSENDPLDDRLAGFVGDYAKERSVWMLGAVAPVHSGSEAGAHCGAGQPPIPSATLREVCTSEGWTRRTFRIVTGYLGAVGVACDWLRLNPEVCSGPLVGREQAQRYAAACKEPGEFMQTRLGCPSRSRSMRERRRRSSGGDTVAASSQPSISVSSISIGAHGDTEYVVPVRSASW